MIYKKQKKIELIEYHWDIETTHSDLTKNLIHIF